MNIESIIDIIFQRMTKKDMHLSTLARSFGIMTITVEDTGTAEEDSR